MAALLQTRGRNWIQESYETGDPSIKTRAKQLRSRGYRVATSSMGPQVTQYGVVKMTLLDVRPGTSGDEYLEQVNPSKRKVRRRVAKALKKYVRGNASVRKSKKHMKSLLRKHWPGLSKSATAAEHREITRILKSKKANPPRVKGRKTKGGRAVTLKNFTGTIVKKSDGTVQIVGRGRRK